MATDAATAINVIVPDGFGYRLKIFSLQSGATSVPMKGDMAVYLVSMTTLSPAGEMPAGAEDVKVLADKVRNRAEYQAFNALKAAAAVKDDRSKYY